MSGKEKVEETDVGRLKVSRLVFRGELAVGDWPVRKSWDARSGRLWSERGWDRVGGELAKPGSARAGNFSGSVANHDAHGKVVRTKALSGDNKGGRSA